MGVGWRDGGVGARTELKVLGRFYLNLYFKIKERELEGGLSCRLMKKVVAELARERRTRDAWARRVGFPHKECSLFESFSSWNEEGKREKILIVLMNTTELLKMNVCWVYVFQFYFDKEEFWSCGIPIK